MNWKLLIGIAAMAFSMLARAEGYPGKPITLIVPAPPGARRMPSPARWRT